MNMKTSVAISVNGNTIDWHDLDNTLSDRVRTLIHARDMVGFATVRDEDQYSTPLEVTMALCRVPLATVNNVEDALRLRGLDDMTEANYYWDAMKEVRHGLMAAVEDDQNLMKAIKDCSLGQLFLVIQGIKANIDQKE